MLAFCLILAKFIQNIVLKTIILYQKTLSPDHSALGKLFPTLGCRFYPSCSVYAQGAIANFGLMLGIFYSIKRIVKCNPLSDGGYDPLPQ